MATTAPDRESASGRRASSAFRATPADGPGATLGGRAAVASDDGFGFTGALWGMPASRFIRDIVLDRPRRRDSSTT
jgi:hypothetical protein